ncbi:MAG: Rid family hydrolase [Proteobacteria bacterium]|nr:Rid family hydrolase [Pseudomonadota bacterium]
MTKRTINPWTWQEKFGFVQANEFSNFKRVIFCAGIVSVDENGELLHPGDMVKQMRQILNNLETLLNQADAKFADVARLVYYTTDVTKFTESSHVLVEQFKRYDCQPATSLIGVSSLFHPDCVFEVEATVVV